MNETAFLVHADSKLTPILPYLIKDKRGQRYVKCRCSCGAIRLVNRNNLASGTVKTCGRAGCKVTRIHGMKGTPTYNSWSAMLDRCTNTNSKDYKDWGGRGITVCERWKEFANFFADMGEAPAGHQIERRENDKGYYLENCRWATRKEQARNRRSSRYITVNNTTLLLVEWSEKTGLSVTTISERLRMGWTEEKAVTTPARRNKRTWGKK